MGVWNLLKGNFTLQIFSVLAKEKNFEDQRLGTNEYPPFIYLFSIKKTIFNFYILIQNKPLDLSKSNSMVLLLVYKVVWKKISMKMLLKCSVEITNNSI
jgi:hypothetical protein